MYEWSAVRHLYKKLLALYPHAFQEELGESMEQTFHDLYKERQTKPGLFSFVFWMFTETAMGITREYILLLTQGDPMKNTLTNLRSPALISLIFVVPFMILELVNRQNFNKDFPLPLFVIMWLLPMIFIVTLMPMVRNMRMGNGLMAHPINLLIRVILLILIAWIWTSLLIDQMPCFLGVPNCD